MKKTFITLFIVFLLVLNIHSQVKITNTSVFNTDEQLLLANEINESGEPFAEASGFN
mgnify:CR=1 FL=1